jgi:glyoxylase-like metal-dependent hydrolase (beta-lactamase superfamily II)
MLHANVADGVHRIEDAYTNWYLIEDGDRLTIVDTGVPASWRSLRDGLGRLRRSAGDVSAVVLTHAHSRRNLEALDALAATGARTVLVGHGEPWTGGAEAAVTAARAAGVA